jgi:hypothetical protein
MLETPISSHQPPALQELGENAADGFGPADHEDTLKPWMFIF